MNSFVSILGAGGVPEWVSTSFPIIRLVIVIVIAVLALAMILAVLVQPSASNGANPITGGQSETFYGKNKSHTLEGFWKKLTIGIALTIAVLAVLYFVTYMIYAAGV